LEDLLR